MRNLVAFFHLFYSKLRLSKPWQYKVPLLITFPYFLIRTGAVQTETFLWSILASFTTIIGFAGVGYLTNDLSDRAQDSIVKKENALINLSSLAIYSLLVLFVLLAILPWSYLPWDTYSILLIIIEFALFFGYAFPPLRLKERGLLGLFTDALYAHVVPAILASYTFYLLIDAVYEGFYLFLIAVGVWQFVSGFRNILSHQLIDYENDVKSNTTTWVVKTGKKRATALLKICLGIELVLFLFFLAIVALEIAIPLWVYTLYGVIAILLFAKAKPSSTTTRSKQFSNLFLDHFYTQWLPLLILASIIFIPTEVTYVLLIHLLLFAGSMWKNVMSLLHFFRQFFLGSWLYYKLYLEPNYYVSMLWHLLLMLGYFAVFSVGYYVLAFYMEASPGFFFWQNLLSKILVGCIVLQVLSVLILKKKWVSTALYAFIFEKNSAYNLAVFRILFYGISFGIIWKGMNSALAWTALPASARVGLPYLGWFIEVLPISPEIYTNVRWLGMLLAFTGIIGFKTKYTLKVFIPIIFYLWAVPNFYGKLNHNQIMVWIPILLAFSRCSDVWSIDALILRMRHRWKPPQKSLAYGLPLTLLWIHLAMIYCFSGIHKLWDTGLYWALSDNIVNQIRLEWIENYDMVIGYRVDQFPILLRIGALGVIFFEIVYPLFLLKPATRFINFMGAWMLHLTAGYLMNIDFVNLRRSHFSMVNWEGLRNWSFNKKKVVPISDKSQEKFVYKNLLKQAVFYPGILLVTGNFICGMVGVNSYPFSAYPYYSGIVDSTTQVVEIHAFDANNELIDVRSVGKEQAFRWENIRPFEIEIARLYAQKDSTAIAQKIKEYWQLWTTKVDGLEGVTKVSMRIETISLVPEERDIVIESYFLGSFAPNAIHKEP
ncbi:MAG: hypothetical protein ABNH19_06145 [Dokdonia sp.]|jgi:hypothetical protein